MRSLVHRVVALEAVAPPSDPVRRAELQRAARALFDALEVIYPNDPWQPGLPHRSSIEKIEAAASRLLAGELSEDERQALDRLPADALEVFQVTRSEALRLAAGRSYCLASAALECGITGHIDLSGNTENTP